MTPPLIAHLEAYLGPIQKGWKPPPTAGDIHFQVIEALGGRVEGVRSFATIGLSEFPLASPSSSKVIHHELLISLANREKAGNVPAVLQDLGMEAIRINQAFVRGQVIGPRRGQVISNTPFTSLYVAIPVYWPDEFSACPLADKTVIIAWLVPITSGEATFIRANGWDVFEKALTESDLDMCDMGRPELPCINEK